MDGVATGEGSVAFEVQGEVHRIQAGVLQSKAEVALVAGVEGFDVVTDVVADNDAVPR